MRRSRSPGLEQLFPAGEPGLRSRLVRLASGLHVRVVEAGNAGQSPVLLIPGWGCTAWIFRDTLRPLASAGHHVVAVELKGHGLSDKPAEAAEYRLDAMRGHVLEIMDALGFSCAAIVGHSMGAAIAAHAAADSPARVTGLVLVAPVGFAGVPGLALVRMLTPRFAVPLAPHLATRALVKVLLSLVYGSLRRPTRRDVNEFLAPAKLPGAAVALRHLLHELPWSSPFPPLRMPLLTLLGTRDRLSPVRHADRYRGPAGDAPVLVVDGAGHVILDEAPGLVNNRLVEFLGRQPNPAIFQE